MVAGPLACTIPWSVCLFPLACYTRRDYKERMATLTDRIDALTSALWYFGSPAALALDPDSERIVALGTKAALVALVRHIGGDQAACDTAIAAVREFVAARSADALDLEQAEKIARALRRGVLAAKVRRHPRAASFGRLIDALVSGRASKAQISLAKTLATEAA